MMTARTSDATSDTVEIIATPEIARQLDAAEADGKRAVLVHQVVRYALDAVEDEATATLKRDLFANYDPEAVRASMRALAGSWADVDTDKLIEDIYRWREEGTRPSNRP